MPFNWIFWLVFNLVVLAMLALDLGLFHRRKHVVEVPEAVSWTLVWIALAAGFAAAPVCTEAGTAAASTSRKATPNVRMDNPLDRNSSMPSLHENAMNSIRFWLSSGLTRAWLFSKEMARAST